MPSHPEGGLADRLRDHTRDWHQRAERSGIVRDLLAGRASRHGYACFLRNLLPAYQQLEASLERHDLSPGLRRIARPEVYRSAAIEADLHALCGSGWPEALPLLAAASDYGQRVAEAAQGDGARLMGHAYVRYLGDLNGGRILRRCLARAPGLPDAALTFYDYPGVSDLAAFTAEYRAGFDAAASERLDCDALIEEAVLAFRCNIAVAEAVAASAG